MNRGPLIPAVLLTLAGLFAGCGHFAGTVVPATVEAKEIIWSGNDQTAGVMGANTDQGVPVNEEFRGRYDLAISIYGKRTPTALAKDAGLTPAGPGAVATDTHLPFDYWLSAQDFTYWSLMNSWRRDDEAKKAKRSP